MEVQQKEKKISNNCQIFDEMNSKSDKVSNEDGRECQNSRCAVDTNPTMELEHPNGTSTSSCEGISLEGCIKSDSSDCKPKHSSPVSSSVTLLFESTNGRREALQTTLSRYYGFGTTGPMEDTGDGNSMDPEVPKHSSEGICSLTDNFFRSENAGDIDMSSKHAYNEELGGSERKSTQDSVVKDGSRKNSSVYKTIDSAMRRQGQKKRELLTGKGAEMEQTYDPDEALEVARFVAKEVEQEIGIYREASGSSSFIEDMIGETVFTSIAVSKEINQTDCLMETADRSTLVTEPGISDNCSTKEEMDEEISAGNEKLCLKAKDASQKIGSLVPKVDGVLREQELSALTTMAEDQAINHRTYLCSFDLNEDVQNEELHYSDQSMTAVASCCHAVNLSTPIPILATSPACLPTIPLHFEGELGWSGSSSNSAFRPALFCKATDKERMFSIENNNASKESHGFRGIDLNVADDSVLKLFPDKHVPLNSMHKSGNSLAVCSRPAEKLNLDLNRLGDNDDNSLDLSNWGTECSRFHPEKNRARRSSPSSLPKHSLRDFDLNDNPSFGESETHDICGQSQCILQSEKRIVDANSTFGSIKHLVPNAKPSASQAGLGSMQDYGHGHGRGDFQLPAQPFMMVGSNIFRSVEQIGKVANVEPTLPYTPLPAFSYDRFGMGPTVPFPSSVYPQGVVPYMMDLQGAMIIPQQILGSNTLSSFPGTPYFINVTGASGTHGIGTIWPSLDLNAGVTPMETEASGGNVIQHFFLANNSLLEEQMKSYQQMAISVPMMKRKEPESGWESDQVGYKQLASWN